MDNLEKAQIAVYVGIPLVMLVFWIFQSHIEMSTFNQFSNKGEVNLLQAMFSNLRVIAQ